MNGTVAEDSVAIITRTLDRDRLLPRAIESVLGQTHRAWHHVIVNDGGDPAALERVLEPFRERYAGRLSVIHHAQRRGMEAAANAGIAQSASRYIAIHDDDDSWCPEFLARCVASLGGERDPATRGVVTRITQIHEVLDANGASEKRRQDYNPTLHAISLPLMAELNPFLPIAFVYEREALDAVGYYDETLPVVGDWDFNIRFLRHFDIRVIPENLANYHVRVAADEAYRNSVHSEALHAHYRAIIVNRYLRRDLEDGRLGLGQLLALGDSLYRTNRDVGRIGRLLDKFRVMGFVSWLRARLRV